jgi:hypothetical protein
MRGRLRPPKAEDSMTPEFTLLTALFGLGMFLFGYFAHDRYLGNRAGIVSTNPPTWIRQLTRSGIGPLRSVSLAFELYGIGLVCLAGLVLVSGVKSGILIATLSAWFLVGIPAIGIVDAVTSLQSRLRRDREGR